MDKMNTNTISPVTGLWNVILKIPIYPSLWKRGVRGDLSNIIGISLGFYSLKLAS